MKSRTVSMLVCASALSLSALNVSADTFSYNYVEGSIGKTDNDVVDSDTYGVAGSYDIAPSINLIGSATNTDADTSGLDASFNTYELGVGYHTKVAEKTDATANLRGIKVEGSDTGFGVGAGLRHLFTDQIEGDAAIDYVDVSDQTATFVSVGGRYYFSDTISAGLGYSKTGKKDTDAWAGTLRMNFL